MTSTQAERIAARLARESGTLLGQGRRAIVVVYPSPYSVGMSSLGFQQIYRLLNCLPDTVAERAFRPDADDHSRGSVLAYESGRPIADFRVVAFSVACEIEILGVFEVLSRSGIPLLARDRTDRHPYVVIGGPLTFSNPAPLSPFADAMVIGEGEDLLAPMCDALFGDETRAKTLARLAGQSGFYVPAVQEAPMPEPVMAHDAVLPAVSAVNTDETTLASMWLVEAERGCSRQCAFCVMRRGATCGMRLVSPERIMAALPATARRVGLVGAAVSDHPALTEIVRQLVARGCNVGLSSLRADRLTPALVSLLVEGGQKTLTIAADGASERLREWLQKGIQAKHLRYAAELARDMSIRKLKCYVMLGVPGEGDADVDELAALVRDLAKTVGHHTKVVVAAATFVPKLRTPLAHESFAGVGTAAARAERLRRALGAAADFRADSPRWAWVEYLLAQGGAEAGMRALDAWQKGGTFAAFKKAFAT